MSPASFNSLQGTADRYDSALMVEMGDMKPKKATGFRAKIKAKREEMARETRERRAGDGQGGGMNNYFRILKYGNKWDIFLMVLGAIASMVIGVAFPLMTLILGKLVNNLGEFFEPNSKMTPKKFEREISTLCTQFLYVFFTKWVIGYISMVCWRLSSTRISAAIRLEYITCIFRQDLTYFDTLALSPMQILDNKKEELSTDHTNPAVHKPGTPGSVALAVTVVSSIVQQGIGERMGGIFQSSSMLIAGFTVALLANKNLALAISSVVPVSLFFFALTMPIDVRIEKRIIMAQSKAADLAEEILGTIRTVKSFNAESVQAHKYDGLLNRAKEQGLRKAPIVGIRQFTGVFIQLCAYSLCFWYGAKMFEKGVIKEAGTIITVFFASIFGIGGLTSLAIPIQAVVKACSASAIIFQVIDRKPLVDALSQEGREPHVFPDGDIEMCNVRFTYPGGGEREKYVVLGGVRCSPFADSQLFPRGSDHQEETSEYHDDGGFSMTFPGGKTTAIVGPSGAGKSTIVALLERWYEPQEGSILIDGVDIGEYNLRWWRSQIGFVMQEPFLFNASIFRNIADGLHGTRWENAPEVEKRKMVHQACVDANAADFVDELPDKYDSDVGENGIKLSGGQKQRIAIARSIISRPSILILDEATSALDPVCERLVQKALDNVSQGRTTIMIAHRLSTIKNADKIIVLEQGNIVETGNYRELLSRPGGTCRKLVKSQELLFDTPETLEADPFVDQDEDDGFDSDGLEILGDDGLDDVDLRACLIQKEQRQEIGIFKLFCLILSEQRKTLWLTCLGGLFGAVGAGVVSPIQAMLFANYMYNFQNAGSIEKFVSGASFWALMFFVLALGGGIVTLLMGWMLTRISHITGNCYRSEYFRNVLKQEITYFDKSSNSPGDLTSRLSTHPMAIQEFIGAPTGMIISALTTFIVSCSLAIAICHRLSLIIILATVPLNFLAGFFKIKIEKRFIKDTLGVFEESSQFSTEAVGAYRTVSSLVLERPICARFKKLLQNHVQTQFRRIAWSSVMYSAVNSIGILVSAFAWWYGGRLMAGREIGIFQFYLVYLIVLQGADVAGSLVGSAHGIAFATVAANRMLGTRGKERKPQGERMKGAYGDVRGCKIEFQDVKFRYESRSLRVFNSLSLSIEKGQFAAFVGASGCGKTTAINLLERFYGLEEGKILIDGQNLASLDLKSYRDVVSLVAQEPTLYQGTIRENIIFGASENVTDAEIIQAAKDAYLDDFITTLPDGYNTLCGSKGIGLSGGQKQRLAIARALIRRPRILLLDEATASLDSESEKAIQEALEKAAEGRNMTVVAVAHRLSTIQNADVIFVFSGGRIVEKGNHQTLIRRRGMYFQMCESQSLN